MHTEMFKDTAIYTGRKKREGIILLMCLLASCLLHVIGIIQQRSPAGELLSQLHVILLLTGIFYGAVVVLRVLYYLISRLWIRK